MIGYKIIYSIKYIDGQSWNNMNIYIILLSVTLKVCLYRVNLNGYILYHSVILIVVDHSYIWLRISNMVDEIIYVIDHKKNVVLTTLFVVSTTFRCHFRFAAEAHFIWSWSHFLCGQTTFLCGGMWLAK